MNGSTAFAKKYKLYREAATRTKPASLYRANLDYSGYQILRASKNTALSDQTTNFANDSIEETVDLRQRSTETNF